MNPFNCDPLDNGDDWVMLSSWSADVTLAVAYQVAGEPQRAGSATMLAIVRVIGV